MSMRLRTIYRAADGDWESCVRSQGAGVEGDWGVIVLCTVFPVTPSINIFSTVRGWILSGPTSFVLLCSEGLSSVAG